MSAVREALYDLRYRWLGVRIGGPDATMRGQWLVLSLSLLIVFACFFAIGRFYHAGAAPSAAGVPSAQAGASGRAIPSGLSGGSPIAGAVPVSIAVKPRVRPAATEPKPPVAATAQPFGGEAARSEVPVSQAPAATVQKGEAVTQAAPKPAAAAPRSSESASTRGAAREKRQSQPSTGATFDTSE